MSSVSPPVPVALLRPGLPAWLVVAIACIASFMVVMDGSIVNVALPALQRDLGLAHGAQHWVIDAYLLALGGCMLLAARAGDLYGRRPVLQWGLALFTLASLAAGCAQGASLLLAARALQGIGAAVLATSSMTLVVAATHHDPQARARALSLWAALNSAGFAFGVVAGGLLTEALGWRWVMFVNVPVGAALMAGVAGGLLPPLRTGQSQRLDWPGALLSTLGCVALVWGITQSAQRGWGDPWVLGSLGAAALLGACFVAVEGRSPHPLVRLSVLDLPGLRAGNVLMLVLGATLAASIFLLSAALQHGVGYGPRDTGLALLPMALALAAMRQCFAGAMAAGQARWLPAGGSVVAAAGLAWLCVLPPQPDYLADVLGPMLLVGCGLGMVILSATLAVTRGVPPQDAGLASGLANTARQLGGALGVAGAATLAGSVGQGVAAPAPQAALLAGYHAAFGLTAVLSLACGLVSLGLRRR
jgi:EmrB/QacA subfamily drug resistance transporter